MRRELPDDVAPAQGGFVADHAFEVQDYVHVELAVAVVPLPDLHPADECARVPLAEPSRLWLPGWPFQSGWSWITATRQ